ncbi:hypothetical protein AC579_7387 [Pseudocercospora musae]|uniref:Uncharacterized protein n=1 Tax=Pseudocercospora musae TaxID=113226 RepID=A0A139H8B8_9PEZI|nr:hypothetical protein AC579_7387 [Pseudocercospora musae]
MFANPIKDVLIRLLNEIRRSSRKLWPGVRDGDEPTQNHFSGKCGIKSGLGSVSALDIRNDITRCAQMAANQYIQRSLSSEKKAFANRANNRAGMTMTQWVLLRPELADSANVTSSVEAR